MCKTPNTEDHLLPERHPQDDLFICDVADAVLKDVKPHMEHPVFTLSKKPNLAVKRYDLNGNWLEITPSFKGLASIYDKDILIYCISQIMHKYQAGEKVSRRVRLNTRDLLIFTNRGTAGKDYKAIVEALDRLAGTRISTNIKTGDEEQFDTFGLIDAASIRRKHGKDGRLLWCEVKISDWVFNAIRAQEVLTLHRDYFRLRKPIERRVYEIARKHCGRQSSWSISLEKLHKKSGSKSSVKEFRRSIRFLVDHYQLPDYTLSFAPEIDIVRFENRGTMHAAGQGVLESQSISVSSRGYDMARAAAPGWDIYSLEQSWRGWMSDGGLDAPRDADKTFEGFCRKWFEKRGTP